MVILSMRLVLHFGLKMLFTLIIPNPISKRFMIFIPLGLVKYRICWIYFWIRKVVLKYFERIKSGNAHLKISNRGGSSNHIYQKLLIDEIENFDATRMLSVRWFNKFEYDQSRDARLLITNGNHHQYSMKIFVDHDPENDGNRRETSLFCASGFILKLTWSSTWLLCQLCSWAMVIDLI